MNVISLLEKLTATWFMGIVFGALIVVGLLTFVKRIFQDPTTKESKAPWWVWHIAMAILSGVVSLIAGGGISWILLNALALIAVASLEYQLLVKLPSAFIKGIAAKAGAKLEDTDPGKEA